MGTAYIPYYANLFRAQFEEKKYTHTSKICPSYIDDIFIIQKE